jgi:O-antigen ligase
MTTAKYLPFAQRSLFIFALVYPLVLFPGAPFMPLAQWQNSGYDSAELFQLLPKICFLFLAGLMGFMISRPIAWRDPLIWLLGGHLGLVILGSGLSGDDFTFSFLGPPRRMDGIFYHLGLVLLGIFVYSTIKRDPQKGVRMALSGLFWSGLIQAVIAMLQRLGVDLFSPLVRYFPYNAPVGTIGQPGMLAGLLLCAFLAALVLYHITEGKYRWGIVLGLLVIAAGVGVASNRSALIALVVGAIGLNISQRSIQLFFVSALAMMALLGGKYLLPNIAGFERDYGDTVTFNIRLHIWNIALEELKQNPRLFLTGGGPDGFKLAMLRNPPVDKLLKAYSQELGWPSNAKISKVQILQDPSAPLRTKQIWVTFSEYGRQKNYTVVYDFLLDKAHNFILDRLLAYGLFAVAVWLLLYLYPLWRAIISRNSSLFGFSWILAGLFVYYLAWFPVVQVEPLHILTIAAAWAVLAQERVNSRRARTFIVEAT